MSLRKNYGKLDDVLEIPDLIGVQLQSYADFLQQDVPAAERENKGLEEVFREIFPIESFDQSCVLDYVSYEIGEPKLNKVRCIRAGKLYAAPLYTTLRLENKKKNEIKEEQVFLGEIPLMTDSASFVINGVERVIISQLHRTPGICFEKSKHTSGRVLYSLRIIPDRGSWLEVQFDVNDLIYIFLDRRRRRRKFLISTFLRAVGYESTRELLDVIYGIQSKSVIELIATDPEELSRFYIAETTLDKNDNPILDENENQIANELEVLSEDTLQAIKQAGIKKNKRRRYFRIRELSN